MTDTKTQISVSLGTEELAQVDSLARKLGISRSATAGLLITGQLSQIAKNGAIKIDTQEEDEPR